MLASLQYFPSPGQFRALESSMGHGSGGEEVGRQQTDHSRSIQQGASFFSRDACIEHSHRQLQGWDRGWGPGQRQDHQTQSCKSSRRVQDGGKGNLLDGTPHREIILCGCNISINLYF